MDKKVNWAQIVSDLEQLIARNNPESTNKNPEIAVVASVFFMGSLVMCTAILLNDPE
ncbi:hypothetical protein [uncultured Nostoc sp.]|uniref:hypothetical protein n=1 Tax=uncultured Nostoc sp. TaxID=340711 RepID=UPI0035CA28E8